MNIEEQARTVRTLFRIPKYENVLSHKNLLKLLLKLLSFKIPKFQIQVQRRFRFATVASTSKITADFYKKKILKISRKFPSFLNFLCMCIWRHLLYLAKIAPFQFCEFSKSGNIPLSSGNVFL